MLDTAIVVIYLLGILILGIYAGRGTRSLEDYSVAGRQYGSLIVFATLSASFIGGGYSLGNAGKVFAIGIGYSVALWGFSLKELLVASLVAPRLKRFPKMISVGDIMEVSYGKVGKVVTGFFAMVVCAGIVGAQVGAIGDIFHVLLGLNETRGILIGAGIVITYATIGGMRGVIWTDVAQFVVLAVGVPLTLVLGIREAGGMEALVRAVPADRFDLGKYGGTLGFTSLFLTFLLGETLVPPYVQRLFIGKDMEHTATGTLWSGIFSIPFFIITGAIGLVALAIAPDIDSTRAIPEVVLRVLPIGLRGLVVAGILSIVMSSADSFLNAAAIAFTNDLVRPLRSRPMEQSRELWLARLATLVVGLLAVFFAIRIESVLDILIYAYNFWAPVLLVPLLGVIFGVRASHRCFLAAAVAGVLGNLVWSKLLGDPAGIDGLIVGVFWNAVVFIAAVVMERDARDETPQESSDGSNDSDAELMQ